jgi:hypothetical protein
MQTYWIGTQPNPADRRQITVSDWDDARIEAAMRREHGVVTVYDLRANEIVTIERADCGLGCRCALQFSR